TNDGRGLPDSKRMPLNGFADTCRRRSFRDAERTADLPLHEHQRFPGWKPRENNAAHLAEQAPLARRQRQRRSRGNVEHSFHLVVLKWNVVEEYVRLFTHGRAES